MNRKDKDNFIILGFIVGSILLFLIFNYITQHIYYIFLIGFILFMQTFLVIPNICKYYYELNDLEPEYTRFIPFYQELTIFQGTLAKCLIIAYILFVVSLLIIIVIGRIPAITSLISLKFIIESNNLFIDILSNLLVILTLAIDVMIGMGFTGIKKDINKMNADFSNAMQRRSALEFLYYILLYIPIIRIISLLNIWNILLKIQKLNKYSKFLNDDSLYIKQTNEDI